MTYTDIFASVDPGFAPICRTLRDEFNEPMPRSSKRVVTFRTSLDELDSHLEDLADGRLGDVRWTELTSRTLELIPLCDNSSFGRMMTRVVLGACHLRVIGEAAAADANLEKLYEAFEAETDDVFAAETAARGGIASLNF